LQEISTHPQMRENDYVVEIDHPSYGKLLTTGVPARYSHTAAPPVGIAPDLGEHTAEVLREICGMEEQEILALAAAHATTPGAGYTPPGWMAIHRNKPKARL
jgi:crotonobetainyl-CoA:carnitine CoA-transferase CaiB-like acyl-CoA transferase